MKTGTLTWLIPWVRKQKRTIFMVFVILAGIWFWFTLPDPLFNDPNSTILLDREGHLLGARIAGDHQWRFPENLQVPAKFRIALTQYEDRYFFYHPGINPVSMIRALGLNFRHGRIVSGGSTLTMQVIRLSRKNRPRTYAEKFLESILAFRLELTHKKRTILGLYAAHAPFGGNVVGLEAASWRYFGVSPEELSWGETALLAVLPNNPGMIYPGRNPSQLRIKRNHLLDLLHNRGFIDSLTCELAKQEAIPSRPLILPQLAPHLMERAIREGNNGNRIISSVSEQVQRNVLGILSRHALQLRANEIYNAAALVLDVNTGEAIAYAGNLPDPGSMVHGNQVDIITSGRSTGSIMKPFLYAAMMQDGLLLPNTLIPDIPMQIGGFIPENYNLTFDGAVPAKRALSRSLNIPAVKMLQVYGYDQFYGLLRKIGLTSLTKPAGYYGLALILGGAEASLWDIAGIYASMARTLNHFNRDSSGYFRQDFHPASYLPRGEMVCSNSPDVTSWLDAASIWLTFEAMVEVSRPEEELFWQRFASSRKIAWKTGTSFGNRDAWSIGVTPDYVVAVWVGNASGEGRPGLTGIGTAAPILFDLFNILPSTGWFRQPFCEMASVPVCRMSGYRASDLCTEVDTIWISGKGLKTETCPYHHLIHLDQSQTFQVNSSCESPATMIHLSWFTLPPVMEHYFRKKNPLYRILPPFRSDCNVSDYKRSMDLIYPKHNSRVYIPVDLGGIQGAVIFRAAHHNPQAIVYWHLDEGFICSTSMNHQIALSPAQGWHTLTLTDNLGETRVIRFEVISK